VGWFLIVPFNGRSAKMDRGKTLDKNHRPKTMKTIALKNGMVIFLEQVAFIHIQPSAPKDGAEISQTPEIHVHFSATFSIPKGSRSMRTVVLENDSQDFIDQLEKHGVDCSHMRRVIADLKK
jgi:hypothetical protein